jgi:hypothetical protein
LLVIPLEQSLRTGLIVLATAAGAPFLPKLVQGANGNVAFGVGLMVLLMSEITTVMYGTGADVVTPGGSNHQRHIDPLTSTNVVHR